uniref:Kinesin heavy chain isolog n=1 Tax=Solanum tuberosum TaxID=4113 RepID=M1ALL0_SOLTU
MANVMKPLMNWPKWHHYLYVRASFIHFVQSQSPLFSTFNVRRPPSFTASPSGYRQAHFRSGAALKSRESPLPLDQSESDSDSDEKTRKSRNEKKREARRAVRWAMDLAKFSAPQIKRILRVASTEQEIYEAVMLAKRLGPDVREGKRRQFSYIDYCEKLSLN